MSMKLSFHTSKDSMLDMIEKNPTMLEQHRSQMQVLLAEQLEYLGVNSKESYMRQLKDYHKSLPNSSGLNILRAQ